MNKSDFTECFKKYGISEDDVCRNRLKIGGEEVEEIETIEPEEVPITLAEMTAEEKENYFMLLLDVVDRAIADESCTEDDYALIASSIYDEAVKSGAIDNPDDMAIFEDCFSRLAEKISA